MSTMNLMNLMGFSAAIALGTFLALLLKCSYQRILRMKAEDGTAEFIDGKAYYIITAHDWKLLEAWRLPVLRHADKLRCSNESGIC